MVITPIVIAEGQQFVDEYAVPQGAQNVYALSPKPVAALYGAQPVVVSFNRVQLRWMKPDGHGGLAPR